MKGRVPRILSVAAAVALALGTAAAPTHPAPVRADTGVSISGAVTGSGGNLGMLGVGACSVVGSSCYSAHTDSVGNYTITGVVPGDYVVSFGGNSTYYGGDYSASGLVPYGSGTPVTVGADGITLPTIQLPVGSVISGSITNFAGHAGIIELEAWEIDKPGVYPGTVDSAGNFSVTGVSPGVYVLHFVDMGGLFFPSYYVAGGLSVPDANLSDATPITVPPDVSGLAVALMTTAPGRPTAVTATAGDGSATVSWVAPNPGASAITQYAVTGSDGYRYCVTTGATNCTISGLVNGTSYTFTVTATSKWGPGPASDPSNAVTPEPIQRPQSISFSPIGPTVYGGIPIPLNARASSGLPVSYAASGACSVAGDMFTPFRTGTCTITASQAGDPHWLAADPVTQSFSVDPHQLSISAAPAARLYGSANPPFTPAISGFVNGDTAASLTAQPTCTTTATATSPVGTYPITCSGAVAANYTPTYFEGTLTITPAPLTVGALNAARSYGAVNPAFTPTYSGFVNGDTAAGLTTQPTCASAATPDSPVGTYFIFCSGAASANYTMTYVPGVLTIAIADRFVTPVRTTLNVYAPGFLALANAPGATVIISSRPAGRLTLGTDGAFDYAPKSGFVGVDSFAYRLKVGGRLSAPVTVTIYVVGPGMACKRCNLSGLWVGAVALNDANLKLANLSGSRLDGANLKGANISGADLSNASLYYVNLRGADLSGADLSNANLGFANLRGANLSRAVLTNVDLTGADLSGANVTGVTWSNTMCPDGTNSSNHGGTCRGHLSP